MTNHNPILPIKVAIAGVGNCAKSLVEGISFYAQHPDEEAGLLHPSLGPYRLKDIEFVAAFDVDKRKVGQPLHVALAAKPNNTHVLAPLPAIPTIVARGPTLDSIIPEMREYYIHESAEQPVNVTEALVSSGAEILLNYLPTGSNSATAAYAEAALSAGCSFINCMPSRAAKDPELAKRFASAGLVLFGDDIKSQCGATIVNRALLDLFALRGVRIISSSQVNYGGNADHFNLKFRADSKKECKEAALLSVIKLTDAKPHASMTFQESCHDHKRALISINGRIFGGAPVSLEVVLEDEDSPNSGGIVVDAIRAARLLCETGNAGRAGELCASMMKYPPEQADEHVARARFDQVVAECIRCQAKPTRSTQ